MRGNNPTTRRKLLAMTGAGVAAGLAGCFGNGGNGNGNGNGSGNGGGKDPSELPPVHFLTDYNNEAWQAYWEDTLIPEFQDETDIGVEIEYSGFSGGGQEGRLATLIQAGDPPALSTGTMVQVGDMYTGGQLLPTNDVVDDIRDVAGDFHSQPYEDFDGKHWQIPHGYYTSVLHYRTDVYEELGLEVPTSFAALRDNAKAIDESDMDIRGYGMPGQKTGKSKDEFNVHLANAGAALIRAKDPDADKPEPELWFPKDRSIAILEHFRELASYSTDPTSIGWGSSIKQWLSGNYAQQYHLNGWTAGIAAANGLDDLAENTGVAPFPLWEEGGIKKEDSWFSDPTPDGHFLYKNSDNPEGAKELMRWLYGDNMERTASMYSTEPTRFLPNYADVLESDPYGNIELFQENPFLLEQLKYVQNEIVANYYNNVEESRIASNIPENVYVQRFFFLGEMVNQVLATGRDPEAAYDDARQQAKKRLDEGRNQFEDFRN